MRQLIERRGRRGGPADSGGSAAAAAGETVMRPVFGPHRPDDYPHCAVCTRFGLPMFQVSGWVNRRHPAMRMARSEPQLRSSQTLWSRSRADVTPVSERVITTCHACSKWLTRSDTPARYTNETRKEHNNVVGAVWAATVSSTLPTEPWPPFLSEELRNTWIFSSRGWRRDDTPAVFDHISSECIAAERTPRTTEELEAAMTLTADAICIHCGSACRRRGSAYVAGCLLETWCSWLNGSRANPLTTESEEEDVRHLVKVCAEFDRPSLFLRKRLLRCCVTEHEGELFYLVCDHCAGTAGGTQPGWPYVNQWRFPHPFRGEHDSPAGTRTPYIRTIAQVAMYVPHLRLRYLTTPSHSTAMFSEHGWPLTADFAHLCPVYLTQPALTPMRVRYSEHTPTGEIEMTYWRMPLSATTSAYSGVSSSIMIQSSTTSRFNTRNNALDDITSLWYRGRYASASAWLYAILRSQPRRLLPWMRTQADNLDVMGTAPPAATDRGVDGLAAALAADPRHRVQPEINLEDGRRTRGRGAGVSRRGSGSARGRGRTRGRGSGGGRASGQRGRVSSSEPAEASTPAAPITFTPTTPDGQDETIVATVDPTLGRDASVTTHALAAVPYQRHDARAPRSGHICTLLGKCYHGHPVCPSFAAVATRLGFTNAACSAAWSDLRAYLRDNQRGNWGAYPPSPAWPWGHPTDEQQENIILHAPYPASLFVDASDEAGQRDHVAVANRSVGQGGDDEPRGPGREHPAANRSADRPSCADNVTSTVVGHGVNASSSVDARAPRSGHICTLLGKCYHGHPVCSSFAAVAGRLGFTNAACSAAWSDLRAYLRDSQRGNWGAYPPSPAWPWGHPTDEQQENIILHAPYPASLFVDASDEAGQRDHVAVANRSVGHSTGDRRPRAPARRRLPVRRTASRVGTCVVPQRPTAGDVDVTIPNTSDSDNFAEDTAAAAARRDALLDTMSDFDDGASSAASADDSGAATGPTRSHAIVPLPMLDDDGSSSDDANDQRAAATASPAGATDGPTGTSADDDNDELCGLRFNVFFDAASEVLAYRMDSSQRIRRLLDCLDARHGTVQAARRGFFSALYPHHFSAADEEYLGDFNGEALSNTRYLKSRGYASAEDHFRSFLLRPSCTLGKDPAARTTMLDVALNRLATSPVGPRVFAPVGTDRVVDFVDSKFSRGNPIVQSLSFSRTDAYMKLRELIAMLHRYGTPTYFITITANFVSFPGLSQLREDLDNPQDIAAASPYLLAQFSEALHEIRAFLSNPDTLPLGAEVVAIWDRLEFQVNVGHLPHGHLLVTTKPIDPARAMEIISAMPFVDFGGTQSAHAQRVFRIQLHMCSAGTVQQEMMGLVSPWSSLAKLTRCTTVGADGKLHCRFPFPHGVTDAAHFIPASHGLDEATTATFQRLRIDLPTGGRWNAPTQQGCQWLSPYLLPLMRSPSMVFHQNAQLCDENLTVTYITKYNTEEEERALCKVRAVGKGVVAGELIDEMGRKRRKLDANLRRFADTEVCQLLLCIPARFTTVTVIRLNLKPWAFRYKVASIRGAADPRNRSPVFGNALERLNDLRRLSAQHRLPGGRYSCLLPTADQIEHLKDKRDDLASRGQESTSLTIHDRWGWRDHLLKRVPIALYCELFIDSDERLTCPPRAPANDDERPAVPLCVCGAGCTPGRPPTDEEIAASVAERDRVEAMRRRDAQVKRDDFSPLCQSGLTRTDGVLTRFRLSALVRHLEGRPTHRNVLETLGASTRPRGTRPHSFAHIVRLLCDHTTTDTPLPAQFPRHVWIAEDGPRPTLTAWELPRPQKTYEFLPAALLHLYGHLHPTAMTERGIFGDLMLRPLARMLVPDGADAMLRRLITEVYLSEPHTARVRCRYICEAEGLLTRLFGNALVVHNADDNGVPEDEDENDLNHRHPRNERELSEQLSLKYENFVNARVQEHHSATANLAFTVKNGEQAAVRSALVSIADESRGLPLTSRESMLPPTGASVRGLRDGATCPLASAPDTDANNVPVRNASLKVDHSRHLFVNAGPGDGKTHLALQLLSLLTHPVPYAVEWTAMGSDVASRSGGVHIHELFKLTPKRGNTRVASLPAQLAEAALRRINAAVNFSNKLWLQRLAILIVDEFSQVNAETFHAMDIILRNLRGQQNVPFGGVRIVALGDSMQLDAVEGSDVHGSFLLRNTFDVFTLSENVRAVPNDPIHRVIQLMRKADVPRTPAEIEEMIGLIMQHCPGAMPPEYVPARCDTIIHGRREDVNAAADAIAANAPDADKHSFAVVDEEFVGGRWVPCQRRGPDPYAREAPRNHTIVLNFPHRMTANLPSHALRNGSNVVPKRWARDRDGVINGVVVDAITDGTGQSREITIRMHLFPAKEQMTANYVKYQVRRRGLPMVCFAATTVHMAQGATFAFGCAASFARLWDARQALVLTSRNRRLQDMRITGDVSNLHALLVSLFTRTAAHVMNTAKWIAMADRTPRRRPLYQSVSVSAGSTADTAAAEASADASSVVGPPAAPLAHPFAFPPSGGDVIYCIRSGDRTEVGWSTDLRERWRAHNRGAVPATRGLGPWSIFFYVHGFTNKPQAMQFEDMLQHRRRTGPLSTSSPNDTLRAAVEVIRSAPGQIFANARIVGPFESG